MQATMEALSKPMNLNHQIAPRAIPFAWKTVQTYGKVSFHWNGTTPRLIIVDPEMMKDVMTEKNGHIQKPPVDSYNPLIRDLPKGITNQEGEKWFKHRRIINPAFHIEKLKGMMPAFTTSCSELIARWKKLAGSCELDIWPEMETLTSDIISRTAFGSNYDQGKRLFELQNEQIALVIEAYTCSLIFHHIPLKQMMKTDPSSSNDLLDLLLQSNNSESSNRLTIEEVIEDYASELAREEVEQICGKNIPDFNAINRLKIVITCMRTKLRNLSIPAGVILTVPLILAHHDPEYWGVSNAPKDKFAYFPFSRGPKVCIGQNFHFSFQLSPSYTHAPCVVSNLAPQHGAQITLHKL
ncbi:hypothetical protein MKX03_006928 [Papaver bracteatum]|nr:hypothetical protein MKX03_006928 [Papaver bracteatum]